MIHGQPHPLGRHINRLVMSKSTSRSVQDQLQAKGGGISSLDSFTGSVRPGSTSSWQWKGLFDMGRGRKCPTCGGTGVIPKGTMSICLARHSFPVC